MINVAALHVLTTVTSRGRDAWVGACGSQAKRTLQLNRFGASLCDEACVKTVSPQ